MKHAAEYAKRIKRLFGQLRKQYPKPEPPDSLNPLEHLVLAILSRGTSETRSQAAFERLREAMVDFNELRVTPPAETADAMGPDMPDRLEKARAIVEALNAVYDKQNAMDLSHLKGMSVREARDFLRSLAGVDEFAAARVVLLCLGGHAVPIDEHTAAVLKKEDMIAADATIEEIQAFLERHILASEALAFSAMLHRYAAGRTVKAPASPKAVSVAEKPKAKPPEPPAPAKPVPVPAKAVPVPAARKAAPPAAKVESKSKTKSGHKAKSA